MTQFLSILISTYAAFSTLNLVAAIVFYYSNKQHKEYLYNIYYWITVLLCFGIQGIDSSTPSDRLLSFASSGFLILAVTFLVQEIFSIKLPYKKYTVVFVLTTLITFYLTTINISTIAMAFPLSLTYFFVMSHIVWLVVKNSLKLTASGKIFLTVLFLNGLHLADFAFVYHDINLIAGGFLIAAFLSFLISVMIPFVINDKIHDLYAANLETELNERTKDLKKSNQELQTISNERRDLIRIICHDLANYISISKWSSERYFKLINTLLTKQQLQDNPKLTKHSNRLIDGLNLQTALINEVRSMEDFSQVEDSQKLEVLNLSKCMNISLNTFENKLKNNKIGVKLKIDHNHNIKARETQLISTVFNNLISNSIKFSPNNSTIIIRSFKLNNNIYLLLKDFGIGIPASLLKDIFNPNIKTTRKGIRDEKGTGFGLPLVKATINKWGHDIIVKSVSSDDKKATKNSYSSFLIILKS